jgi:hypothetical protein
LTLSTGVGNTVRSAFYPYPLYVGAFYASFTYQDVGAGAADGAAFVLHNDPRGTAALGGGGGAVGYGAANPITPSAALLLNIYAPNTVGIAVRTNGNTGGPYAPTTPVNVASGDPIDITMLYGSGNLRVTLSNTVTASTFTTNYVVGSLPARLGAETAYVGFTGADGGLFSTQQISKFQYIPFPVLNAAFAPPSSVKLTWPASIGGYNLEASSDITNPGIWTPVLAPVNQTNGVNEVTVPAAAGQEFYDLFLPLP